MLPENPADLIAGKKYGSEGTAQRYLCALLISGPEYGYNKTWPLTDRGVRFVSDLYGAAFGSLPAGDPQFWNEFNLRAVDAEDNQAVDYAFLWPGLHFLVELKTLGSSDRPGQLSEYVLRARHHNPDVNIDLLYLTQPMTAAQPGHLPDGCRYHHITWPEVMDLADKVWGDSEDARERRCLELLREHLASEGALTHRGSIRSASAPPAVVLEDLPQHWRDVVAQAMESAAQAAAGGRAAVDVPAACVSDTDFAVRLGQVRTLLEAHIAATVELAGVRVWKWTTATNTRAYTATGEFAGMELRLSPPAAGSRD